MARVGRWLTWVPLFRASLAQPTTPTPAASSPAVSSACLARALIRDLIGGLAGKKHTVGDYTSGAAVRCAIGAGIGLSLERGLFLTTAEEEAVEVAEAGDNVVTLLGPYSQMECYIAEHAEEGFDADFMSIHGNMRGGKCSTA
jgi:hypothetical protein